MQVSESVRAVQVPDGNPMHPQFTTIYLVGRGQVLTIDSGEDEERYRWMLRGYLAATERAEIGLSAITHFHADHSSNLRWLQDEFDAEVHVIREAVPLLENRLPDHGVSFWHDGDQIQVGGGVKLDLLHTPGHSPDSVCYYLEREGVLLTGDTILGGSTTTINDLFDYIASLQRLRALPNLRVICPGHGPLIDNPIEYLDDYISHRNQREQQIVDALAHNAVLTSWEIMESIYTDLNPRLRRAADRQVQTHLKKLEKEGRLTVFPGSAAEAPEPDAQALAEEHQRLEIIRKAEEYKEEARRRALALQENPPAAAFGEPPRYQLS